MCQNPRGRGLGVANDNVFDIQEGVAIGFFIKNGAKHGPAAVHHANLWGDRKSKYTWLGEHDLHTTGWTVLCPNSPSCFFIPQPADLRAEYEKGWKITEVMPKTVLGFQSHRDHFALDFDAAKLRRRITALREATESGEDLRNAYNLTDAKGDGGWKLSSARTKLRNATEWEQHFGSGFYRPFDRRAAYFNTAAMDRPRTELQQHMQWPNLSPNTVRQTKAEERAHVLVADAPTSAVFLEIKDGSKAFPRYLYLPSTIASSTLQTQEESDSKFAFAERVPNLSPTFVQAVTGSFGYEYVGDGCGDLMTTVGPEDLFNYIYAVLHSPTYRHRYAELLRTDFPRIPLTRDKSLFQALSIKGAEKVWEFDVGGYQVCERWLRDRRGMRLSNNDLTRYEQIIVVLTETIRLMEEVDGLIPSWPTP